MVDGHGRYILRVKGEYMGSLSNLFLSRDAKTALLTRRAGKSLFERVINEYISLPTWEAAARYLDKLGKNQTLVQKDDTDMIIFIDFLLSDYTRNNGKTIILKCIEDHFWQNDLEYRLLLGFYNSQTTLLEFVDVIRRKSLIVFRDLLENEKEYNVIDINLSKIISNQNLVFSRVVAINGINTLGGASMIFDTAGTDILLKEYTQKIRRANQASINMERYRIFYELNQKYGVKVAFR